MGHTYLWQAQEFDIKIHQTSRSPWFITDTVYCFQPVFINSFLLQWLDIHTEVERRFSFAMLASALEQKLTRVSFFPCIPSPLLINSPCKFWTYFVQNIHWLIIFEEKVEPCFLIQGAVHCWLLVIFAVMLMLSLGCTKLKTFRVCGTSKLANVLFCWYVLFNC